MPEIRPTAVRDGVLPLPDGRDLGYAVFGDPEGYPVFLFHGTPGSRLWFSERDPAPMESGHCLIALDRPGYGLSSYRPGRGYRDWPEDVTAAMRHFGIQRCGMLSVSGGAPFALACASVLGPSMVDRAVLAVPPCPPGAANTRGMAGVNRRALFMARLLRRVRWLGRLLLKPTVSLVRHRPQRYFAYMEGELCPSDREISRTPRFQEQVHDELIEAYRSGVEGVLDESAMLTEPWDIDLGRIALPVEIWAGSEDSLAPPSMAEALHRLVPGSELHIVRGGGHFLLDDEARWRSILAGFGDKPP